MTPEDKDREEELWCIDMINSILAYSSPMWETGEGLVSNEEHSDYNYLDRYIKKFGREKVVELAQKQIDDVERIERNTFTDDEGCTYNSIVWKSKGIEEQIEMAEKLIQSSSEDAFKKNIATDTMRKRMLKCTDI